VNRSYKSLFLLLLAAYLVSAYGFKYDPLGLIIKKRNPADVAAAAGKKLDPKERTKAMAREFIRPGVTVPEIEDRFNTKGVRMGAIFKTTLLVGEQKYMQYKFYLGHGVTAYVLCETFSNKVAQNRHCLSFEPH